jgi:hypothetical protein
MSAGPRLLLALALPWVAVAACSDMPPADCRDIPAAGCPVDNGADACEDPTCAAVYTCQNGGWVLDHACPGYVPDAGADGGDAGAEAASGNDAAIDAPPGAYGGPGCTDLQPPDCSLGTAISCAGAADCCGCIDLFVCVDGGWDPWGSCVDGGIVGP